MTDQTLNQALAARGWTTEPGTHGRKRVYDRSGDFVGELTASETWDALHDAEAVELVAWANEVPEAARRQQLAERIARINADDRYTPALRVWLIEQEREIAEKQIAAILKEPTNV